jgi:hypothetical protein
MVSEATGKMTRASALYPPGGFGAPKHRLSLIDQLGVDT